MRQIIHTTTRNVAESIVRSDSEKYGSPDNQDVVNRVRDRLNDIAESVGIDKSEVLPTQSADLLFLYEANVKSGVYENEPEPVTL